jgi:hypothetical protein
LYTVFKVGKSENNVKENIVKKGQERGGKSALAALADQKKPSEGSDVKIGY